ncbi:MAG: sigma-70 family RNA polymerase sigma factor [bacterium]|nr:sigma-70 family RNA polymerase sigma factor [bacterium]
MTAPSSGPLTELLVAVGRGDTSAHDKLWTLIYDELRRVARAQLAGAVPGRDRQPTSLVHEAYLRLSAGADLEFADRRHFFAAAAQAMRHLRIDDVRKRNSQKRGGGRRPVSLEEVAEVAGGVARSQALGDDLVELLALDEALTKLEQRDPRRAQVAMLRYFAGLSIDETAEALGLSPRAVDNDWHFARAWLHRELA